MEPNERIAAHFDRARRALGGGLPRTDEAQAVIDGFDHALVELEHDAWQRGFDLGAGLVQRTTERQMAEVVMAVLGKDRADGAIDLGALRNPEREDGQWFVRTVPE